MNKSSMFAAIQGNDDALAVKLWQISVPQASMANIAAYIARQKSVLTHWQKQGNAFEARRQVLNTNAIMRACTSDQLLAALEAMRRRQGLTKTAFCKQYHIKRSFYAAWTTQRHPPRQKTIDMLRAVLQHGAETGAAE